jgi:hypothetical protein
MAPGVRVVLEREQWSVIDAKTIDKYSDIQKPRPLQSDTAALRDRRLLELSSKIEKLKQARLQTHLQQ